MRDKGWEMLCTVKKITRKYYFSFSTFKTQCLIYCITSCFSVIICKMWWSFKCFLFISLHKDCTVLGNLSSLEYSCFSNMLRISSKRSWNIEWHEGQMKMPSIAFRVCLQIGIHDGCELFNLYLYIKNVKISYWWMSAI